MKHAVALVFVIMFALGLTGCGGTAYELPHGRFCSTLTDNPQEVELKTADKEYIIKVLNDSSWINDLSNCGSDFVFYIQNAEVRYHSECGTFNDITNHKAMHVPEETRIAINTILGVKNEN